MTTLPAKAVITGAYAAEGKVYVWHKPNWNAKLQSAVALPEDKNGMPLRAVLTHSFPRVSQKDRSSWRHMMVLVYAQDGDFETVTSSAFRLDCEELVYLIRRVEKEAAAQREYLQPEINAAD